MSNTQQRNVKIKNFIKDRNFNFSEVTTEEKNEEFNWNDLVCPNLRFKLDLDLEFPWIKTHYMKRLDYPSYTMKEYVLRTHSRSTLFPNLLKEHETKELNISWDQTTDEVYLVSIHPRTKLKKYIIDLLTVINDVMLYKCGKYIKDAQLEEVFNFIGRPNTLAKLLKCLYHLNVKKFRTYLAGMHIVPSCRWGSLDWWDFSDLNLYVDLRTLEEEDYDYDQECIDQIDFSELPTFLME